MNPWYVTDTDFSERISDEDMSTFRRVCPDRPYAKGDLVFRAGDPATAMHVIARGQVKLVTPTPSGAERILAICGPNDFIGEAFVADDTLYRVDAVALTDVVTCPISREQFAQMSQSAPTFAMGFAEILAAHLFDCRDQLSSSFASVEARVIRTLLDQTARFGEEEDDGWARLSTELKHEDIAGIVSATRVSVSMAIADLRHAGLLEGTRGEYRLHVPALRDRAEAID